MNRHQYADEKNVKALFRLFNNVYKTGIPVKTHEVELTKKDGAIAYNEISVNLIRNKNGSNKVFRGISRDITERKRQQEKIHYLATHDSLTGLPNRMMLNQLLSHAINAAKRHNRKLAVFSLTWIVLKLSTTCWDMKRETGSSRKSPCVSDKLCVPWILSLVWEGTSLSSLLKK